MRVLTGRRLAAFAAAVTMTACLGTGSAAFAQDKLRMVTRSSTWDDVLLQSGLAEKYGLEIEPVPMKSGVDVAQAIVGGSADIGSIGTTPLTSMLTQTDVVGVIGTAVSIDGGYAKMLVPPDSTAKTLDDLKGKKIATMIGSGSYRVLVDWCKKHDCSVNDFQILNTSGNAIVASLQAGSVDGGLWFAPTTEIAVRKGVAKIMMDFKGANRDQSVWVANRKFAEANPDVVVRFLAAATEAQNILVNDPDRAAELLEMAAKARGLDLSKDVIRPGIDDFDFTPRLDASEIDSILSEVFDSLKAEGKLRGDKPDFSKAIMGDYFTKAQEMVAAGG